MTPFEALRRELDRLAGDADFPDWLLPTLRGLVDHPDLGDGRAALISQLLDQLRNFDPYAGAGCFSAAASLGDIERTLKRLAG